MASATSHNKKSSAVKRILSEARELGWDDSDLYTASPLEDNIFEWHFTLRGPANTEFASGLYHGRILLPAEYPMRPPNLMLLTPNGRWEPNKKICLTFTGFHEEMWQPAWGIRTALLGLQTFMTAKAEAAAGVGALDYPLQARQRLARQSREWKCEVCGKSTLELLPDPDPEQGEKREQEALPDGLNVDFHAETRKQQAEKDAAAAARSSTTPEERPDAPATSMEEAVAQPIPTPQLANGEESSISSATPTSSANPTCSGPSVAAPIITSITPPQQLEERHNVPTTTNATRISATEQKLSLIDNCIKALGLLVALLLFKRLV
ncbi:putative UBC6 - E2 ubiquitin-conjugating enzyme [Ustilago hordei]|uniref:Probable UBC6-E2 ubiquitin-conjugating enzyme n=1 Tax=Ustilago hordei TaxID=120017 RepID=I2FZ46_USTHO|nr:putative UBC6 - E2 ubiquitin-conjugating enzyme [Ustilago hordei]CCF52189.1 probable UBC6-E2 ubiquitin-conjugating enzyme [Ustilago hordei]SYW83560.1 probable UBC6 - E2 ubiquitin-conjugating enzyme [Ustilago hordei]